MKRRVLDPLQSISFKLPESIATRRNPSCTSMRNFICCVSHPPFGLWGTQICQPGHRENPSKISLGCRPGRATRGLFGSLPSEWNDEGHG